ncbi:hypothetical protein AnigIFM60653_010696 [Aspergillus niger]|uniref:YWTD domain-containing protein n=1 Tax=Aspergillus welwitschiae TaxID=1341132 RepID=A0A3F3PWH0_9EURO|nr:hypothetical protein BDQ94DRAFT_172357 [Aspergillus welwitschiae]RDH31259.1 hypothetical protein BDQ94DRAFT_172357 [Aspergillus welwitschiae]GLA08897.1 hypothetical protein AnigIFM60653_010696 [Aspergillus niger]
MSCQPDGSSLKEIVTDLQTLPDGVAVDSANGHIYWTNMGESMVNDGSIQRCDISGGNIRTIVPPGRTHTPKQLKIANQKLYWCDREGMQVMRANLDGSEVEVLHRAGVTEEDREDRRNWCVGIAVDESRGKLYWTQKGQSKGSQGKIMCMDLPQSDSRCVPDGGLGDDPRSNNVTVLLDHLPEPIDLDLDIQTNTLYWSDRGDPPFGNSINAAQLDAVGRMAHLAARMLVRKLHEGIGLSLDLKNRRMFFGDLLGGVYSSGLDGTNKQTLFAELGDITGILYVED